ncbi:TPA: hypothetical protein F7146_10460 [Legionella pneumophila]|nr:hypothetical protein [Legionella pneumophila]
MQSDYVKKEHISKLDNWLPEHYFCNKNQLQNVIKHWTTLDKLHAQVIDGWRFSENRESGWYQKNIMHIQKNLKANYRQLHTAERYEQTIKQSLFYRMRHIESMKLQIDSHLMRAPAVDNLTACVKEGDVLVRRVGTICACIVSNFHRQHPVDANIAIIRGLEINWAIWLGFCLNQSYYRHFLEQLTSSTTMLRVGVKHLEQLPIAEMPNAFIPLARAYHEQYNNLAYIQERLYNLRLSVSTWVKEKLSGIDSYILNNNQSIKYKFVKPQHINDQLTHAASWQAQLSEELISAYNCHGLFKLAIINPQSDNRSQSLEQEPVIKISNINSQLAISEPEKDFGWRTLKSTVKPLDVLISTFVQEPKVAIVTRKIKNQPLVSEQLAILRFHHTPGAYALLMETDLVKEQMQALAHGTSQRFIQHKMLEQIVIPELEQTVANAWHQELIDILDKIEKVELEISDVLAQMYSVYRTIHPEQRLIRSSNEPIH